jgi:hypothetical protein
VLLAIAVIIAVTVAIAIAVATTIISSSSVSPIHSEPNTASERHLAVKRKSSPSHKRIVVVVAVAVVVAIALGLLVLLAIAVITVAVAVAVAITIISSSSVSPIHSEPNTSSERRLVAVKRELLPSGNRNWHGNCAYAHEADCGNEADKNVERLHCGIVTVGATMCVPLSIVGTT